MVNLVVQRNAIEWKGVRVDAHVVAIFLLTKNLGPCKRHYRSFLTNRMGQIGIREHCKTRSQISQGLGWSNTGTEMPHFGRYEEFFRHIWRPSKNCFSAHKPQKQSAPFHLNPRRPASAPATYYMGWRTGRPMPLAPPVPPRRSRDPEGAVPTLGLVFPALAGDGGRGIRAAIAPWASLSRFVELLSPNWSSSLLMLFR